MTSEKGAKKINVEASIQSVLTLLTWPGCMRPHVGSALSEMEAGIHASKKVEIPEPYDHRTRS